METFLRGHKNVKIIEKNLILVIRKKNIVSSSPLDSRQWQMAIQKVSLNIKSAYRRRGK